MNSIQSVQPVRPVRPFGALCLSLVLTTLAGCASIPDDEDPELVQHSGMRAKVVIDEDAFLPGRERAGATIDDGNGRTVTISYALMDLWGPQQAHQLEQYFTDALVQTNAFAVLDKGVLAEHRAGGAAEASAGERLLPDLKLRCVMTELNPNAEIKHDSVWLAGLYWIGSRFTWLYYVSLGGGLENMSRKATCEIRVSIVDVASAEVIATATGRAWSVGSASRTSGFGGGFLPMFGVGSSSASKDANLSLAIERATKRAVNELLRQVPEGYFKHAARR
jgi:curli biogenesis system outer membrane secretion channel CsgG